MKVMNMSAPKGQAQGMGFGWEGAMGHHQDVTAPAGLSSMHKRSVGSTGSRLKT